MSDRVKAIYSKSIRYWI